MSEPIAIKTSSMNVIVSTDDVTDATALRELAGWMDDQEAEYMIIGVNRIDSVNHGGKRLTVDSDLSVTLSQISENQDYRDSR